MNERARKAFGGAIDRLRGRTVMTQPKDIEELRDHYAAMEAVCQAAEMLLPAISKLCMSPEQNDLCRAVTLALEAEKPLRPIMPDAQPPQ